VARDLPIDQSEKQRQQYSCNEKFEILAAFPYKFFYLKFHILLPKRNPF